MNIVACPKCAAQFDVSSFQPGSTFVCGSCGNVLKVPSAAAPKAPGRAAAPKRPVSPQRSAPARPAAGRPAAPGRAGAGRKVDPRRAGGAAPVPAAPAAPPGRAASAGRRTAGARRGGGYDRPEKSKMPLVIGGVGAVVVVIALIAIIAFSSGDGDTGYNENVNGTNTAGNQENPVDTGPTKAEQERELKGRAYRYEKDASQLHAVYLDAKAGGFSRVMDIAADYALKMDEEIDWANEHKGRKDLKQLYDQMPKDITLLDTYPNEAYDKLVEMREFDRWGTPDEFDNAQKLLKDAMAHGQRLRTDQKYVDIWQIRQNVELHPFYSDFPYSVKSDYPYVVFVQTDDKAAKGESVSDEIVDRNVRILKCLYEEFHKVFGKRFDLPKLEDMKVASERTLKVFALANEKLFHEYQRKIGQPLPGGVRAYYKPSDQWITLFEGGQWEKRAKEGESSFNINKIFHEGTHQLMHVYTKILMERKLNEDVTDPDDFEEVPWVKKGVHSNLHWFQEGFAELFAASKPNGDSWDLIQMHRNRLEEWKGTRKRKKDEWPFEVMIKISDRGELMRKGMEIGLHPAEASRLSSLFYAQAWVFAHYLWYAEDGKYREKFLEYMEMELTGKTGYRNWVKVWGNEDWEPLGKKVDAHFDKLCEEMGVK